MKNKSKKVEIRKTGKTWGIFVNGVLVEGGFFKKTAAIHAAGEYQ